MNKNFSIFPGWIDLEPFRAWCCSHILPTIFDESMSYEEQICKMKHYLNDMIHNLDLLPEMIRKWIIEYVNPDNIKDFIAELIKELIINVKNPPDENNSMKGDGVTDDTDAFQNLIEKYPERFFYLPSGNYLIQEVTGVNIKLVGENRYNTIITHSPYSNKVMFTSGGTNTIIKNITFKGNSVVGSSTMNITSNDNLITDFIVDGGINPGSIGKSTQYSNIIVKNITNQPLKVMGGHGNFWIYDCTASPMLLYDMQAEIQSDCTSKLLSGGNNRLNISGNQDINDLDSDFIMRKNEIRSRELTIDTERTINYKNVESITDYFGSIPFSDIAKNPYNVLVETDDTKNLFTTYYNVSHNGLYPNTDRDVSNELQTLLNKYKKIYLPAGNYLISNLNLSEGMSIAGEGTLVLISFDSDTYSGIITAENSDNISLYGITLTSSTKGEQYKRNNCGIMFSKCNNILFKNITIKDYNFQYGCLMYWCENVVITRSKLYDYNYCGFAFSGCINVEFSFNRIKNTISNYFNNYAVSLDTLLSPLPNRVGKFLKCIGNTFINEKKFAWEAIDAHQGQFLIVQNNIIAGYASGIVVFNDLREGYLSLHYCIISSNHIYNSQVGSEQKRSSAGIQCAGHHVIISNNIITHMGYNTSYDSKGGIFITYGERLICANNEIIDCIGYGILISGYVLNISIENNTISAHHISDSTPNSAFIFITPGDNIAFSLLKITNNIFESGIAEVIPALKFKYDRPNFASNARAIWLNNLFRGNISIGDAAKIPGDKISNTANIYPELVKNGDIVFIGGDNTSKIIGKKIPSGWQII